MPYRPVNKELLKRIGCVCPVCESVRVSTRQRDNTRRCERCGEVWPRKPFVATVPKEEISEVPEVPIINGI